MIGNNRTGSHDPLKKGAGMMKTTAEFRRRFVVSTSEGLHLRPAVMLAKTAERFGSVITIHRNGSEADAKSPLSLILLEARHGTEVTVTTRGNDAEHAMAAISELFATGFTSQRAV